MVLSGCVSQKFFIYTFVLEEAPEKYFEFSEEQIMDYPHLKETIETNTSIEISQEEFNELYDLLKIFDFM
jgi:hypothetical protein